MDKILITIYVLPIEESYDIFLPIGLKTNEAVDLIQNTIYDLSKGVYQIKEKPLLFNMDGSLLNLDNIVKFSGLTNGTRILLG